MITYSIYHNINNGGSHVLGGGVRVRQTYVHSSGP